MSIVPQSVSDDAKAPEIYVLYDPREQEPRYVGKANDSQRRLRGHLREAMSGRRHTPLYAWIRDLLDQGVVPEAHVAEVCLDRSWQDAERDWIVRLRAVGARLLNLAEGGNQPFCRAEVRAENGRRTAQAVHSDPLRRRIWELKQRIGSRLRRGRVSEAGKAKLRQAAKDAPHVFGAWAHLV